MLHCMLGPDPRGYVLVNMIMQYVLNSIPISLIFLLCSAVELSFTGWHLLKHTLMSCIHA